MFKQCHLATVVRLLLATALTMSGLLPVFASRPVGNGNPTTYAGTACTYDVENRLTAFGSEEYSYRADGLRASVGSGSSKVYYLYDQGNAVCQLDYQGNLLRTYVYAPDGMVGRTGSSQTRYYLFDWQGNVEHSMSSSNNLNVSYAFNAWGQRNQKFPVNADVGANDQFGYNARWGYMRENTTGFYYCQNRYYDPANGRWLTRDPIGFAGGMNVYGYCGGGPVGATDPSGLMLMGLAILNLQDTEAARLNRGIGVTLPGLMPDRRSKDLYFYSRPDGSAALHWPDMPSPEELNRQWLVSFCAASISRKPKVKLIQEWEATYGQQWPRTPDGRSYITHHDKPLADGGEDHGRNVKPMASKEEHTKHHSDNGDFRRWSLRRGWQNARGRR